MALHVFPCWECTVFKLPFCLSMSIITFSNPSAKLFFSLPWKGSLPKSFHLPFEARATGTHWESLMECYPFRRELYAFLIKSSSLRLCGAAALIWVAPGNNSQRESLWWLFINICWYNLCVCALLIESNLFCRYLLAFDAVWIWLSMRFVITGDCLFKFLFWLMAPISLPFGLHAQMGTVLWTIFRIVSWYLAALQLIDYKWS